MANPETGNVVVHIGWHKTASTFLQNGYFQQLGGNYQPLAKFPEGIEAPDGIASLIEFVESRDAFSPDIFRRATIPDAATAPTLISHEEISGHSHGYALIDPAVTAENLAAAFPRAKIIAIVRNQFDYILSLYAYRVAVRGHEWRRLGRFLHEEGPAGLFGHIEYDRLIAKYVALFGTSNVLVLPVEMLASDSPEFFRRLSAFIGVESRLSGQLRPSNTSTRHASLLAMLRPVNRLFAIFLWFAVLVTGRWPPAHHPRRKKIYPFMSLRYRFYALKRALTGKLNAVLRGGRRLSRDDIPGILELEARFAESNARLLALGVIDWDMRAHGFDLPGSSR